MQLVQEGKVKLDDPVRMDQGDLQITLPAGNYKLRYKSDESHSFDHWNSLPPDINFLGIAIYKK